MADVIEKNLLSDRQLAIGFFCSVLGQIQACREVVFRGAL
jgi:hypothetical protein